MKVLDLCMLQKRLARCVWLAAAAGGAGDLGIMGGCCCAVPVFHEAMRGRMQE